QRMPWAEVGGRGLPDRGRGRVEAGVVERESVGPVAGLDPQLVETREGRDAGGGDPPGADRRAGRGDPAGADRGGDHVVPQQLTCAGPVSHDATSVLGWSTVRNMPMRSRARSALRAPMSMPVAARPWRTATASVVPEPANGSRTCPGRQVPCPQSDQPTVTCSAAVISAPAALLSTERLPETPLPAPRSLKSPMA